MSETTPGAMELRPIGRVESALRDMEEAPLQGDEVHPRGDLSRPAEGVFNTRSPHRPNPIGLHRVTIVAAEGTRLRVRGLEAIDSTPVVDVKPVLGEVGER